MQDEIRHFASRLRNSLSNQRAPGRRRDRRKCRGERRKRKNAESVNSRRFALTNGYGSSATRRRAPRLGGEHLEESSGKDAGSRKSAVKSETNGPLTPTAPADCPHLSHIISQWPRLAESARIGVAKIVDKLIAGEVDHGEEAERLMIARRAARLDQNDAKAETPNVPAGLRGVIETAAGASEASAIARSGLGESDDESCVNVPAPAVAPSTRRQKRSKP